MVNPPGAVGGQRGLTGCPGQERRHLSSRYLASFITFSILGALLALRWLLHSVFAVRIGWSGGTDFDLLVPGVCSFAVFLYVLFELQASPPLHRSRYSALWVAISFLNCLLFGVLFRSSLSHSVWARGGFFGCALLLVFSIVGYWLPFHYFRSHPRKWFVIPFALSGLSIALLQVVPDPIWGALVSEFGGSVCRWLQPLLLDGFCRVTDASVASASGYAVRLTHSFFAFDIGKGCSGLDGLNVFNSVFIVLVGLYRHHFTALSLTVTTVAGMLWFLFLNAVRVLLIVNGTALINLYFGAGAAVKWGFGLFHSHVGWVVYLIGGLSYIGLVRALLVHPSKGLSVKCSQTALPACG
jgi:exosortase/archaeosortase family protein